MSGLRDFACECTRRSCRRRIYLTVAEYARLAQLGLIVVPEHVDAPPVRSQGGEGFMIVKTPVRRVLARDGAGRFA